MSKDSKDIVIVGAGLIGSSVAMNLARLSKRAVTVLDLDLEGSFSSSELNAGGVRAIWNQPLNAALARHSIAYYETVRDEIGFRQRGYFWMHSRANWEQARKRLASNPHLADLGIEYLTPDEIRKRYGFIDRVDDLGGATFSPKDGLLNPNLLKLHYRAAAREAGVEFVDRSWVRKVRAQEDGSLELDVNVFPSSLSEDEVKSVLVSESEASSISSLGTHVMRARSLVHCTGAWARRFAEGLGKTSPCKAIKRQMSLFECRDVDLTACGMFVDSSGVYFHPEAKYILAGFATPEQAHGYDFEYGGEEFFQNRIWPRLAERSSKFANLKHVTGMAGLYEVSPDMSAVIGRVPGLDRVFEAHSFSGRGAMQSYAAGLALAELIHFGAYRTLEVSALSGTRFEAADRSKWVPEGLLI
ncbi:MAG: FAD-binding oxidoreductase [Deltaproteobacteria bacterium]|nr:FAD-binding oxidoreductase [Deltaproteobacteria bacterium]